MSTTANSSSTPMQPLKSRQSKKSPAPRGVSFPSDIPPPTSLPMSSIVDQEQFLTSSSTTASDFSPLNEASIVMSASNSVGEDGLVTPAGEDVQSDNSENGGAVKKPAWFKPSNGATSEVGAVMGAESWPALSESARASPKSPSTYSPKALPHGLVTVSQESAAVSLSPSKEVNASISAPNSNLNPNHAIPSHQRLMKRGGGIHNTAPANDSLSQAHGSIDAIPPNAGKYGGTVGESSRDNTNKDGRQRGGAHGGNESHPLRNFRRSNSGPLTREHGRRDHERGKQDWGSRSFGRDSHGPQQRIGSRPFVRGPTPNTPFVPPPPPPVSVRPFVGPVGPVVYTEMPAPVFYVPGPHPDPLRPMHMFPVQSMFFPMHDPHLPSMIANQIDYYFSNENLVKDTFLRQNMDAEGWVPIKLIAGFKKVMQLTDNIQLILDSIKASNVVEVQSDKVRRKSDWMKWIMPSLQSNLTSPQSINTFSPNMLAAQFNSVTLDEKAAT